MMTLMRTTITADVSVIEKAKAAAVGRGVTLGQLLEDALRSYLLRSDEVAPPPFQLHTVRGQLVQPNLDLDRTSALLVADDESAYGKSA
jgi:hypothetical protein